MKRLAMGLMFAMLLVGCAGQKQVTQVTEPGVNGSQAASSQSAGASTSATSSTGSVKPGDGSVVIKDDASAGINRTTAGGNGATASKSPITVNGVPFENVYFDYDKYEIHEEFRASLMKLSNYMVSNASTKVMVEGHCDERGTNEYNIALGDLRAKAVKGYLTASGIADGRIDVVTYGEERPVCTISEESCWWQNRRAYLGFN